jgi:hydroxylamine reductase (hybrid-cluster protein)
MKHDELRAKIQHYNWVDANDLIQALDAVVELHKPEKIRMITYCDGCTTDDELRSYPCDTIQAIEKELG